MPRGPSARHDGGDHDAAAGPLRNTCRSHPGPGTTTHLANEHRIRPTCTARMGEARLRTDAPVSSARRCAHRPQRRADDVRQHPGYRQETPLDPRHVRTLGWLPRVSATSRAGARVVREAHGLKEDNMAIPTLAELTRHRWSSDDDADRFPVENPATGKVIT